MVRKTSTVIEEQIIRLYTQGISSTKIAKNLDTNHTLILRVLKRNNIQTRGKNSLISSKCQMCGIDYLAINNGQKYCKDCKPTAIKEGKKQWVIKNIEKVRELGRKKQNKRYKTHREELLQYQYNRQRYHLRAYPNRPIDLHVIIPHAKCNIAM